ncbi:MAG: serine hydrolase domain-containing protein [Patescibacteria group bacterium]
MGQEGFVKALTSFILLTLVAGTACAPLTAFKGQPQVLPSAAVDSARKYVGALVERERLPGLAVTVSIGDDGRPAVWGEGFGFADAEARTPATAETQFRVGSVSKLLTATALMRLSQTGVVDLDTPIANYMSALPPPVRDITLRQLAGHLAGIRHYRGNEFLSNVQYETLGDAATVFLGDTLVAVPGRRYSYSSYGYNLIGAVLESVLGASFPEVIHRNLTAPLEMRATSPDLKGKPIPQRARTYSVTATGVAPTPEDNLSGRWPSGGYLSSTNDLARLGRAVLAPGLLTSASLTFMVTPQRLESGDETSVGIGWRVSTDPRGRKYLHHGGSSNGGAAFLLVYPKEQLVVAMASNAFAQWGERDALAIAAIFLGSSR